MAENGGISQYRRRLDKTLSAPDLANEHMLKNLVKNQILRSSNLDVKDDIDELLVKRTNEVSNFLGMLRSASVNDAKELNSSEASHGSWKLKQDTEEFRVMYREGPEGTPFHTLLAEGYVDGPADVCLCISLEPDLYEKWWPQTTIPTFKIVSSQCVQKVRIGEQISLVRMKLSWPLSAREALIHYFAFEYFKDGLVLVLLNSISDLESINSTTHGFSKDGIPNAQDIVRIDVVGGFAIQKVTSNRSYFRTIANMDIKLNFVPPSLINFISRQLVGSGFKLYKKEVASVSRGDDDFAKALNDPYYTRIREALYPENKSTTSLESEILKKDTRFLFHEQSTEENGPNHMEEIVHSNGNALPEKHYVVRDKNAPGEIEVIDEEVTISQQSDKDRERSYNPTGGNEKTCSTIKDNKADVSPTVEQALQTLEKAISIIREYRSNTETGSLPGTNFAKLLDVERDTAEDSTMSDGGKTSSNTGACTELPGKDPILTTLSKPRNSSGNRESRLLGSNSCAREANHNKVAPASPSGDILSDALVVSLCSAANQTATTTILEKFPKENNTVTIHANGTGKNRKGEKLKKKSKYRCFCFRP